MKELATYLPDEVQKLTLVCIASEADAAFAEMRREHVQALIEQRDADSGRLHKIFDAEIERLKREHAEHLARIEASTIELQRSLEQKLQETKQALMREHAEEIERLKAQHVKAVMRIAVKHFDEIESLRKQAERYEKLRSLNVRDFQALYMRNIRGEGLFDALVDQLPASGEKP